MRRTTNHWSQLERNLIFCGRDWTMDLYLSQQSNSDLPLKTKISSWKSCWGHNIRLPCWQWLNTNVFVGLILLNIICILLLHPLTIFPWNTMIVILFWFKKNGKQDYTIIYNIDSDKQVAFLIEQCIFSKLANFFLKTLKLCQVILKLN